MEKEDKKIKTSADQQDEQVEAQEEPIEEQTTPAEQSEKVPPDQLAKPEEEEPETLDDLDENTESEASSAGPFSVNINRSDRDRDLVDDEGANIRRINTFSSQISSSPIYSSSKVQQGNKLHLLILTVIGLIVIGATIYLLKQTFTGGETEESTPSPSPKQISTPTPIPTSLPEVIDRSEFKIRVLNGTGTSGLAAKTADTLKELGYKTDKVGNATNSAFTKTLIRAKKDNKALIDQLTQDLKEFNPVSEGELKDSDSADAEVTLGGK